MPLRTLRILLDCRLKNLSSTKDPITDTKDNRVTRSGVTWLLLFEEKYEFCVSKEVVSSSRREKLGCNQDAPCMLEQIFSPLAPKRPPCSWEIIVNPSLRKHSVIWKNCGSCSSERYTLCDLASNGNRQREGPLSAEGCSEERSEEIRPSWDDHEICGMAIDRSARQGDGPDKSPSKEPPYVIPFEGHGVAAT